MQEDHQHKYEALAGYITGLVDKGTLLAGSRVPSLREISTQQRTSVSTALQAYRLLEDKGVLEARPQSGFYVAQRAAISLGAPKISNPPKEPTSVAVSAPVLKLLQYAGDPHFAPLGCAIPSPDLLAAGRLDRFLARAARKKGIAYNTYSLPQGDPELRRQIAKRAMQWGQALSPADIVITCGCTEALVLALKATCKPGDVVAIESPTYFGLLHAIEVLNLKAFELPTDPVSGIDLDALERALGTKRIGACLFSSSFNNPLGCTIPEEKKIVILDLLAESKVPLIEDDIYGDIYFGHSKRPKPFMALDKRGRTIYCNSFSKTIAPGYRVGWIIPDGYMQSVLERKFVFTMCGPTLTQAAMADFLSSGGYDHHLRRIRRIFADNLERMVRMVEITFPRGTKVARPNGGFVLWVQLPRGIDTRKLFEMAIKKAICFAPGDVFSASGRYKDCLRLSCGFKWTAKIKDAIATLGQMAGVLVGK